MAHMEGFLKPGDLWRAHGYLALEVFWPYGECLSTSDREDEDTLKLEVRHAEEDGGI